MSSKQPSKTTQTTQVKLPAWVEKASEENYNYAKEITDKPREYYQGDRVADLSPTTLDAWRGYLGSNGGADEYGQASSALSGILGNIPSQVSAPTVTTPSIGNIRGVDTSFDYDRINSQQVGAGYTPQNVTAQQVGTNFDPGKVNAQQVTAGMLADTNLSKYMDPYLQSVVDTSLADMDRSRRLALMGNADKASAAGAFGGSRSGVVDAVTNAEAALGAGQLSAKLRSDAYNNATGLATADLNRRLQGDLANQAAGLTASQANQNAGLAAQELSLRGALANQASALDASKANQSAGLAGRELNLRGELANQAAGLTAGQANQAARANAQELGLRGALANQQTELSRQGTNASLALDASKANASNSLAASQLGLQGLGMQADVANSLAGIGKDLDQRRLQELATRMGIGDQQRNYQQQLLDDARSRFDEINDEELEDLNIRMAALGMSPYGKTETSTRTGQVGQSGTDPIMAGLGAFQMFGSLFGLSDKDSKTDIEKLGKDPETGLDLFAYRYKGDPKSYPKVVGPMAQDVEKKDKKAVRKIGGKRIVDARYLRA